MANKYGLVEFRDYLLSKTAKHIRAADLDNNFRRLTPINPDGKPIFTVTEGGMTFQTIDVQVNYNGAYKTISVIGMGPF